MTLDWVPHPAARKKSATQHITILLCNHRGGWALGDHPQHNRHVLCDLGASGTQTERVKETEKDIVMSKTVYREEGEGENRA